MTVHNHQLFAHTYVDRTLQDGACDEPAAGLIQALRDWAPYWDLSTPEKVLASAVGPTLDYLGFHRVPAADDSRIQLLYPDSRRETLLGLCFTPPPGVTLDDTRKGSFWAYEAVNAARKHAARWAMLTDGIRWRLLDAEHLTPYEVYLEVDLGGLAGGELDLQLARALYGFFGRPAGGQDQEAACSLAHHQVASLKATEEAEKHLRARIETVLGNVSRGFVASDGRVTYTEEERAAIFDSATVAIYRILFALYAEARGLLPAATPAYRDQSMAALAALALTYHTSGIPDPHGRTLWEGLKRIWAWIDKGEPVLGIPEYNGGLFDDEKADHLDRDLTYLREHVVEDAYLTEALVDLTHLRTRGGGWRLLDYRDLSVRHLGSLYEGLLEYKLFVAAETLFERREGNDLLYLVASEHTKKKTDREIEPGGVYFAQNLLERKVSGTYYTPEYIVDYIVKNTVRTGLERLRARLMPRLKRWLAEIAAERDPAQRARLQRQVDSELLRFIEEQVLTFRVCDMAMGSGHFLVNATQVITNFIVEMLNLGGWENPDVDCDPAAWRRRVVERCIYGVDLNPLAVELAKLSLWLVTAAEGRPLSFLDHHLRCGNSVVGARMSDLRVGGGEKKQRSKKQPAGTDEAVPAQLTLVDMPAFQQGMESAVTQVLEINEAQVRDAGDVHAQEAIYSHLRDGLQRRFGLLADLWIARYFGLAIDMSQWNSIVQYLTGIFSGLPKYDAILAEARQIARKNRFFHWELEFPDVFFDRQDGKRKANSGFSVVFGNPPYVRNEVLTRLKAYFRDAFSSFHSSADLYLYFYEQAIRCLTVHGYLGYISSGTFARGNFAVPFRTFLPTVSRLQQLIDFGENQPFEGAEMVRPSIVIIENDPQPASFRSLFLDAAIPDSLEQALTDCGVECDSSTLLKPEWTFASKKVADLLTCVLGEHPRLREVVDGRIFRGLTTGLNEAFLVDGATSTLFDDTDTSHACFLKPAVLGQDLRPWYQSSENRWLLVLPSGWTRGQFGDGLAEPEAWLRLKRKYPSLALHLQAFADQARKRQDKGEYWWELRACDYYAFFERPKVIWPDIAKLPRFSWDDGGKFLNNTGYIIPTEDRSLLGILQSRVTWFVISQICQPLRLRGGLWQYRLLPQFTNRLPIPLLGPEERESIGGLAIRLTTTAQARLRLHSHAQQHLTSILGTPSLKLSQKLTNWWTLDLAALQAELTRSFKRETPVEENEQLADWLRTSQAEHKHYTSEIVALETELNRLVYEAFELRPNEIRAIEESTKYSYGEV